jgi:hypothetical protein
LISIELQKLIPKLKAKLKQIRKEDIREVAHRIHVRTGQSDSDSDDMVDDDDSDDE